MKEWDVLSERWSEVLGDPYLARAEAPAIRFVLVEVFGDLGSYFHDATFHAKVSLATQMLRQLISKARPL